MNSQLLAKDILSKIINENVPFSLALKQAFKHNQVSKEEKSIISATVGCGLRHYLVLERIIKDTYPEIESEALFALLIAIANILFIKRISVEESSDFAQSFLKEEDKKFADFIAPYLEDKKLVPESIEVGSFEFLSYRYNTPISIIKMWNKQYGPISTSKVLKANSKPGPVVVRINNALISDEEFFNLYSDFEKGDIEGVAIYNGKEKFKNLPAYEKKQAEILSVAYKAMMDESDLDLLRGLAIYAEYPNDILVELMSRYQNLSNVEYVAGAYSAYINAKNAINKNTIKGVNIYEANATSIVTCISKPVHTFLVMPDNSHFNLLQMLPDYFLRFDINKLDELIANQINALKEASAQVEDDGYLLYLVDTLSKKESTNVINEFLKEKPDFILVREKQYFPFKKYGGSYFFAVLKKESKND